MHRSVHGPVADWSTTDHLLAAAIDALNVANWQRANAGVKKTDRTKPPKPLPRPGVEIPEPRLRGDDLRARLIEFRQRTREGG